MTPIFDDDVADLRGNAMADDVAPDDVCERVALVALVGFVSAGFATTGFAQSLHVSDIDPQNVLGIHVAECP